MPKHNHPVAGSSYPFNLWVTEQWRDRCGSPERVVVALGPGARQLRDTLLAIVGSCRDHEAHRKVECEIRELFELDHPHKPDHGELRASLDEAAESLAHARKLLGG